MKSIVNALFIMFAVVFMYPSCKKKELTNGSVTVVSVRVDDTLYINLTNGLKDTIFIPNLFTGTYNVDADTVHLEVWDKPKFNTDYYYRYSKIVPNGIFIARKIPGEIPDTIVKVSNPQIYYNQHRVRSFIAIYPGATFSQSVIFSVPNNAGTVQIAYYKVPFSTWMGKDSGNYEPMDFIKYDSLNAKYANGHIYNGYYLN